MSGSNAMPSLESLKFDTSNLVADAQSSDRKIWYTADGDGVILYFYDKPPDLPGNIRSDDQLKTFYLTLLGNSQAKLVEASLFRAAGRSIVRTVIKIPQQSTGMSYIGCLTFPFRDFSFVIKVQCAEHGVTGFRETLLFDRALGEGKVSVDSKTGKILGPWNPDDERHDAEFPKHPLSRLRREMKPIESSVVLDQATAAAAPFPLPDLIGNGFRNSGTGLQKNAATRSRRWWQLWK